MSLTMNQSYGAPPPRPYVRFELRPVERRTPEGQSFYEDVPWAILMAPGSRDTVELVAEDWLANLRDSGKNGRCPPEWPQEYANAFKAWKEGQEQPTHGTPLTQWAAISPAQRKSCEAANIRTVEDLASANAESLSRIGMGSVALKTAAEAWLKERAGPGALAAQVATLMLQLEDAQRKIAELSEAKAKEAKALVAKG